MEKETSQNLVLRARLLPAALFVAANALVLAKYASRVMHGSWAVAAVYLLFIMVAVLLLPGTLDRIRWRNWQFYGLVIGMALLLLLAMKQMDPYSLKVDRFSAAAAFNQNLLNGQSPYAARSHLGQPVSGFPGLFLILLPFYLIGDAGYFEIFGFLLFAYAVFRREIAPSRRAVLLLLLGTAPLFLWETMVRSDLFGNMMVTAFFLFWLEGKKNTRGLPMILAAGFISGLLASTRGIVILPLLLFLTRYLKALKPGNIILFLLAGAVAATFVFLPFYVRDPALFAANNPFRLQSGYIPSGLLCAVLLLAFLLGLMVKTGEECLISSGYLLFGTIAAVMALNIAEMGFTAAILKSNFDLSYFLFSMPFLLLSIFPRESAYYSSNVIGNSGKAAAFRS